MVNMDNMKVEVLGDKIVIYFAEKELYNLKKDMKDADKRNLLGNTIIGMWATDLIGNLGNTWKFELEFSDIFTIVHEIRNVVDKVGGLRILPQFLNELETKMPGKPTARTP